MSVEKNRELSLEEWVEEFARVDPGKWEGLRSATTWLRFAEHATTSVAELVRREEYEELIEAVGYSFGWLCCFVNYYSDDRSGEKFRFLNSLPEMVWKKYPGTCYRCTHKFTDEDVSGKEYLACCCLAVPDVSDDEKSVRIEKLDLARNNKPRPISIDEWTGMIRSIYGPNHRELSLSKICLHFLEEVGEVAKGLRELQELSSMEEKDKREEKVAELEEEIADVFSWTFGLLNKLDQILHKARLHYKHFVEVDLPPLEASVIAGRSLNVWKEKKVP